MKTFKSDISGIEYPIEEKISGKLIRKTIMEHIHKEHPEFTKNMSISQGELNLYRGRHIEGIVSSQIGKLGELEKTVIKSIENRSTITNKIDDEEKFPTTFGQRTADKVADFGGSWTFIILFGVFLLIWICINVYWLNNKGFDPYPFILLNLILSSIAALQAPVIMMSQNRQEDKDRERAKKDYMVNLKSELEIRMLHEKIDHLIMNQQQEVIEMQKAQMDLIEDILKRIEK